MQDDDKEELMQLLSLRTLPSFDLRLKRMESLPLEDSTEALDRARYGLPLTREQFMLANGGFLPEEMPEARRRLADWKAGHLGHT